MGKILVRERNVTIVMRSNPRRQDQIQEITLPRVRLKVSNDNKLGVQREVTLSVYDPKDDRITF